MIEIHKDSVFFQFPDVHEHAEMAIQFRRTLRIPDDGKTYLLPPSHRAFPPRWVLQGRQAQDRVAIPLYQADAMWIMFSGGRWFSGYPCAIKVGTGGINAISGKPWKPELDASEQDYLVVPKQPRLDGFCIAKNKVRQFVAMPLGPGYSVAEQLIGQAAHGDLQIVVYPMLGRRYQRTLRKGFHDVVEGLDFLSFGGVSHLFQTPRFRRPRRIKMSLAAGGRLKLPIYKDHYGTEVWDQSAPLSCTVTLANALQWPELTGEKMPPDPPTQKDYEEVGLPWLDLYAADDEVVGGSAELAKAKSIKERDEE